VLIILPSQSNEIVFQFKDECVYPNHPVQNNNCFKKKGSLNLVKQQRRTSEWPGRKFPLSDYEYETLSEQDKARQNNCN
jgi:hypothetical protein